MADSETQQPVDQQVTSKTSATKQKNPKRVAAGIATAERTRIAREAQKKALIEAQSLIAQAKQADPPAQVIDPVADTPSETTKNVLTTTKWLSVISIIVSLAGIYYKREEIKSFLAKPQTQANTLPPAPPPSPVDVHKEKEVSFQWIEHFILFITMIPKVSFLDTFIKTAAVSGIGLVWVNFTVKDFKMAWHIFSTSPEE